MGRARYEVLAIVGEGGMAVVKLALAHGENDSRRLVVLKHLRPVLAETNDIRQMFLDEGRLAIRFNHPNVIHTYEITKVEGEDAIVMEYLEGQPLTSILRHMKHGTDVVPLELLLHVLIETLRGLQYAHTLADLDGSPLNLVHRDISPPNIFVTYDGLVKILDFGIAKSKDSRNHTSTGVIKGKVTYMAPEQMVAGAVDARADVFACGVLMWEMLARRRLWEKATDTEIMEAVSLGDIPRPEAVAPNVPLELSVICMKALRADPDDRFQSAAEMASALDEVSLAMTGKTGARELGRFLTQHFADQRARVKKAIEAAVATSKLRPSEGLQRINLQAGPTTDSKQHEALGREGPTAVESVKNLADQATKTDGSVSRHSAARTERPEREPPKRNVVLYVVLGAVLLAAVLTVGRMMTPKEPVTVTVPSATTTSEVSVLVSVSPADAVVFVDDKPTVNPAVTTLREGSEHTVRAEAPGHAPKATTFKATRDARVVLALEKEKVEPAASASASAAAAPSAKPVPTATVAPRPSGTATVKKDCSSPYFLDQDGVKRFKPECL